MIEVGRVCVKLAGRDARKKCVIVDVLEKNYVMIDGETRRRKCNVAHLEPLDQKMDLKIGAARADVIAAFKKAGIELKDSKSKPKTDRPSKKRKEKKQEKAEKKK